MQALAEPGTIVATAVVAERAEGFRLRRLGVTEVKGLGPRRTFIVEGRA